MKCIEFKDFRYYIHKRLGCSNIVDVKHNNTHPFPSDKWKIAFGSMQYFTVDKRQQYFVVCRKQKTRKTKLKLRYNSTRTYSLGCGLSLVTWLDKQFLYEIDEIASERERERNVPASFKWLILIYFQDRIHVARHIINLLETFPKISFYEVVKCAGSLLCI